MGHAVAVALLDHIGVNPISRVPLSCFRTYANMREDVLNNLVKYSGGGGGRPITNLLGVNHFVAKSAMSTKLGRNFIKSDAPFLKKESMTSGSK